MTPAFLLNRWVQYAIVAALAVSLYFGWQTHQRSIGKETGVAQESQVAQQAQQGAQKSDHDTTVPQIQIFNQQIAMLAQMTANLQVEVQGLKAQRYQAQQQVAGMTAAQVQEAINQALARPTGSTAPYTVDDQRRIADCFAQRTLCDQQASKQDEIIRGLRDEQNKQNGRFLLLTGYASRWEVAYTNLWNDKSQPKRKAYCLWLCKKKPAIKAPDPQELLATKPAA